MGFARKMKRDNVRSIMGGNGELRSAWNLEKLHNKYGETVVSDWMKSTDKKLAKDDFMVLDKDIREFIDKRDQKESVKRLNNSGRGSL